jgi:hypothetical protein
MLWCVLPSLAKFLFLCSYYCYLVFSCYELFAIGKHSNKRNEFKFLFIFIVVGCNWDRLAAVKNINKRMKWIKLLLLLLPLLLLLLPLLLLLLLLLLLPPPSPLLLVTEAVESACESKMNWIIASAFVSRLASFTFCSHLSPAISSHLQTTLQWISVVSS